MFTIRPPSQSPPWLVYNDEEDLAFKSMVLIRGEEYDATAEIRRIKENLQLHKNDLHALLCTQEGQQPHYRSVTPMEALFELKYHAPSVNGMLDILTDAWLNTGQGLRRCLKAYLGKIRSLTDGAMPTLTLDYFTLFLVKH